MHCCYKFGKYAILCIPYVVFGYYVSMDGSVWCRGVQYTSGSSHAAFKWAGSCVLKSTLLVLKSSPRAYKYPAAIYLLQYLSLPSVIQYYFLFCQDSLTLNVQCKYLK